MNPPGLSTHLKVLCRSAIQLAKQVNADAILLLAEHSLDWDELRSLMKECSVLVAGTPSDVGHLEPGNGIEFVPIDDSKIPVHERLTQALLEAVADDRLNPGAQVIALYSGFDSASIDSMSVLKLGEHLERLTARDLQRLETQVPLDTLKQVVDLAVEIGREGREGKPVGTLFVVGDHRKVLAHSHSKNFDPFKGYKRSERCIRERQVREAVKEIAQMDGAFIIAADGTVEAACRYLNSPATGITLSKGLGARHWAAAEVSKSTKGVAITVSESTGTVRLFQNGDVVLRIEPFRRAMKWQDFEFEPAAERPLPS
jgi:DNA integrity scanning protein DisA with diadenylate cyclase activity